MLAYEGFKSKKDAVAFKKATGGVILMSEINSVEAKIRTITE